MFHDAFIYIASFLPKSILFGRRFRDAHSVHERYKESEDKNNFVLSYTKSSLSYVFKLAAQCRFYNNLPENCSIESFDYIDKDVVISADDALVVDKIGSELVSTGGTSGRPLAFYADKSGRGVEWYWMTSAWSLVGFDWAKSWRAVLRNHSLGGRDYEVNRLLKEVRFDNFRLDNEYMGYVTKEIERRGIEFVHAYPSAAFAIASFWRNENCKPACVKAFLCGSENVFDYQKKLIQEELDIRMFTWFGHSEQLILAHEGIECENYHSNPFYGYAELIGADGKQVKEVGQRGELVGTGYINRKTIFVRYRTGDYAEYVGDVCPDCGHVGLTFKQVQGRWAGAKIYLSNGSWITTTALNLHDSIYSRIDGIQYFQHKAGELEVRVVPGLSWGFESEDDLIEALMHKVPNGINFTIKKVDRLEYADNRKFELLVQNIDDL
ncbi:hypothetical protein [Motiliproteus sediminis]|uniref:hypothetical protein n=1 Tax=Motiliproteus sediminis TaxID=1468178 RepID=UPI001AEFF4BD|nr:hypothetical protein [Motiliproteus sediminis]